MFDPTVFENIKVAFENRVYDLDTIDQAIVVTNRYDRLDLARMNRDFSLQFTLVDQPQVTADLRLKATLQQLADEILEHPNTNPSCALTLRFQMNIPTVQLCERIEQMLRIIWEEDVGITQTVSFQYGQSTEELLNTIDVQFKTKLMEENIPEISAFLHYVLESLRKLSSIR